MKQTVLLIIFLLSTITSSFAFEKKVFSKSEFIKNDDSIFLQNSIFGDFSIEREKDSYAIGKIENDDVIEKHYYKEGEYYNCRAKSVLPSGNDEDESLWYPLENKKSLFYVNDASNYSFGLRDEISSVMQNLGEPLQITEKLTYPEYRDDHITVIIDYSDFEIQYSYEKNQNHPRTISYIKLKTDKVSISEKKVGIGKMTVTDVMELYQDLETYKYEVFEDEKGRKILDIAFATYDKSFKNANASDDGYYAEYLFDYKTKLCIDAQLGIFREH